MNIRLSVIVPFRERSDDADSIRPLDNAIGCFAELTNTEVVVYDTGRKSAFSRLHNGNQANLHYCHQHETGVFAPGRVRNAAIAKATGQYIFLFDADLLISRMLAGHLTVLTDSLASEGPQAFRMLPCLYLSQRYSAAFAAEFADQSSQQALYTKVLDSYLRGELTRVDGIALASSCLLMRRDWFMAIGGFRDEFTGHGCEDFDLIHRLASFYPLGERPDDYPEDLKSQFPAEYQGFRRYFSYYALPHQFKGEFLFHQWHPRPLTRNYHRRRKVNEVTFSGILRESVLSLPAHLPGFQSTAELTKLLTAEPEVSNKLPPFQHWIREQQSQRKPGSSLDS